MFFGFRILSRKRMAQRNAILKEFSDKSNEYLKKLMIAEADCSELRRQNAELRKENQELTEKNDNLTASVRELIKKLKGKCDITFDVLSLPEPCDLCRHERKNCKKLTVGDKEFCVIPNPSLK